MKTTEVISWLLGESSIPLCKPVKITKNGDDNVCREWELDSPIFLLPSGDTWTISDACQGVLILGATGSGKSSGSADYLALKLLRLGAGGLVLCVKTDEGNYWEEIAKLTGRESDIVRVTEKDHGFNVFDYELKRCGRGSGLTVNLVNLFRQLQDLVEASGGRKVGPDFWERACIRAIGNAIELQAALPDRFTLAGIRQIINSSPRTLEEANDPKWMVKSVCAQACEHAIKNNLGYEKLKAAEYFSRQIPAMGDKQRAGIFETWEGLADPLLRTPLRQKFCESTTWTPEDIIRDGKIVIIDLPVKEFDFAGKMAGVIAKFCFQKAVERRGSGDECHRRPCFIWADEFENFATGYDNLFQKTARSSKVCTVYIGQNIPGILASLGGQSGEPFMEALLGNLTTQIYHANAEAKTNRYAAEAIGKDWQIRQSTSSGSSHNRLAPYFSGSMNSNVSKSEHLEYIVQPIEFTKMRTGSFRNNRIVDGIFFQASRTFKDGNNFQRVYFKQRKK